MADPKIAPWPVEVGPFQRIVNVHWATDDSGAADDVFFMSLPQITQWDEPSFTPYYGSDGVIVRIERFQYIFRASGADYSDLGGANVYAYCEARGGNASIIGGGPRPNEFFEATSGPTEPGYFYTEKSGAARYYSSNSIGMDTYEFGFVFDPDPDYRLIGEVSVDISALEMIEQVIGGRTFIPIGFHDLTFASGSVESGKYLVLQPSSVSA